MPVNGVPQSVRGRVFDIQFTLAKAVSGNKVWELQWKNRGADYVNPQEGHSGNDVIDRANLGGVPIDYENDVIICRGVGDVFEDCAEDGAQPPSFTAEIKEFIKKFKVRLIPADEADLALNSLFYSDWIVDGPEFMNTLFEHTEGEAVPLWAGVYWNHKKPTQYDAAGLPAAKDLTLTPLQEDEIAVDMSRETQPYNIWLDKWDEEGGPEVTRDFFYPAIVVVRDRT